MDKNGWTYQKAGVDIEAGDRAAEAIKKMAQSTLAGHNIFSAPGGFSGVYGIGGNKFLLATCDGVGTKLLIAKEMGNHRTVGIDLVAMSINDLIAQGGTPLFFLDYIAVGKLIPQHIADLVEGITSGCREAGCALIGGETAEMPDLYSAGDYDLAGFAVGSADKEELLPKDNITRGDLLIGLPSTGVHSNGFSLIRKVLFDFAALNLQDKPSGFETSLGEELLKPTAIYQKPIKNLREKFEIKGAAHITGGGLRGNVPRLLPSGFSWEFWADRIPSRPIFDLIKEKGTISQEEMEKTFNMGMGMVVAISPEDSEPAVNFLNENYFLGKYKAEIIGKIIKGD